MCSSNGSGASAPRSAKSTINNHSHSIAWKESFKSILTNDNPNEVFTSTLSVYSGQTIEIIER